MFTLAILLGIYSYLVLLLGLTGALKQIPLLIVTLPYAVLSFFYLYYHNNIHLAYIKFSRKNIIIYFFLFLIFMQALVNLIGVLGPELSFDALWYHLTLPKLYVLNHSVFHIPGGLLYYSDMPKLTEMLYTAGLLLGDEAIAKFIHFIFGILILVAVYKTSRIFLNVTFSILSVVILYSNLVIGWESITAYNDLSLAFFEIMAFLGFLYWWREKKTKWLIESAVMLGLAISVKLLALQSLVIFAVLIVCKYRHDILKNYKNIIKNLAVFISFSILIPSPWFIFALINTGNPAYPIFSPIFNEVNEKIFGISLFNPITIVSTYWGVLTKASDPISPIYIIFLPIILLKIRKADSYIKLIALYSVMGFALWYFTSKVEGSRLLITYLPLVSILVVAILSKIKNKILLHYLIILIILISVLSIGYRGLANFKYVPVILGQQTKSDFLKENLNFSFGDFYDTDGYFKNNIKKTDTVLLYGFHNLYYVDFPFIDSSWVRKGDVFNYIAVQNSNLPIQFSDWDIVYSNPITKVMLYRKGDIEWVY